MTTDLEIDQGEARAALIVAAERTAALLRTVSDPALPVRRSAWSAGEVGAHLVVALHAFTRAVQGDTTAITPYLPANGTFAERLAAVTAGTLAVEPERDPAALADLVTARVREFVTVTAAGSGQERIPTPWYGDGATLSLSTVTALLTAEQLVHGHDLAVTVGQPWPLSTAEAHLAIRAATSMLPLSVNPERAAGRRMSYGVTIGHGGPRFVVRVRDGTVTVDPAGPDPVDCRIWADPATFVLVGYGRMAPWGPIVRGRLRAGGRKPWLAVRFTTLFFNP
jgi:uncharacterized protein (TIGR03083 family)